MNLKQNPLPTKPSFKISVQYEPMVSSIIIANFGLQYRQHQPHLG